MIEIIDEKSNLKMLATIICNFKYGDSNYCLYAISRNEEEDNIFISKIVKNSIGNTIDNNFTGGEKDNLDKIVTNILSKVSTNELLKNKVEFTNIKLNGINKFDKDICYVTTQKKSFIEECKANYNLISQVNNSPIIKQKKVTTINKNNLLNILAIILGITVLVISTILIYSLITK